jgi:hypothetical protein
MRRPSDFLQRAQRPVSRELCRADRSCWCIRCLNLGCGEQGEQGEDGDCRRPYNSSGVRCEVARVGRGARISDGGNMNFHGHREGRGLERLPGPGFALCF